MATKPHIKYNRKRKRWIVTWFEGQKRKRASFTIEDVARPFYAEKLYNSECRRTGRIPYKDVGFSDAVELYISEHLSRKSPTYCEKEGRRMRALAKRKEFKGTTLGERGSCREFLASRKAENIGEKTLHHDLLALNNLFKWGLKHDPRYCEENPLSGIGFGKPTPRKKRRAAIPEEYAQILGKACSCCGYLIEIIRETGMRMGELEQVCKEDFRLDTHFLVLKNSERMRLKCGHERNVPLSDRVEELVRSLPPGRILASRRRLEKHWVTIRTAAKSDLCLHELRHTYATELFKARVPANYVQEFMGHEDIKTTLEYAHETDDVAVQFRNAAAKSYQLNKSLTAQSESVINSVQMQDMEKAALEQIINKIKTIFGTDLKRETGLESAALQKFMLEESGLNSLVEEVCGEMLLAKSAKKTGSS